MLVIGLDSADAELIETWCDEGHLPVMQRLRQEGLWTRLGTTAEVMHVSGWASLYTGATPGGHGMYHAYQLREGEQEVHRTRADECALPPFWKHLDDAGRKVVVMDAFMSTPIQGFGGIEVLEYGTWTWFDEPGSNPPGLLREIQKRFGPYPAPEHTNVLNVPEPRRFRQQLVDGARVKGEVLAWLLNEKAWDTAFCMFGEPHPAGHYLWHVADEDYPTYTGDPGPELRHAVRDVYASVDAAIGRIVESLPDDVTVLVTSGDGMGPNYAGCHLLPELLHTMELYYGADVGGNAPSESKEASSEDAAVKRSLARRMRDLVPVSLRRSISRCLPSAVQHKLSMKWANADIDWARTQAFAVPNANEGYVRINRIGREPKGIVDPGEGYAALLEELTRAAGTLVVPETGKLVLRQAYDVDQVFPGPVRGNLPDLVLTWEPAARCLDRLELPGHGLVRGKTPYDTAPFYSGNHRPNAFLLARGPNVPSSLSIADPHVLDLAPTILAQQGVPSPPHHVGRILGELLA